VVPHVSTTSLVATCVLILALALSSAIPTASADPPPFSAPFPHLFYDDAGWLDDDLLVISKFDILSTGFWNGEGSHAVLLDSLRMLNPDMIRLAYVNPAGLHLPWAADPNHVVNRLASSIDDAWFARDVNGNLIYPDLLFPDMPFFNLSNQCPRVAGKTWGEFIADFVISDILPSGKWEGIMWDHIWNDAAWLNSFIPDSLDLNLDRVADHPDSIDAWWDRGLHHFLGRFRSQAGPDLLAIGNGNTRHFSYLNGRYLEVFPAREGWSMSMQEIADWQMLGRTPSLITPVTRGADTDFKLMRYGLCSALIAGTFTFHFEWESSLPDPVIYDEWLVDLGQPLGPSVELGLEIVHEADFETGLPPEIPGPCGSGRAIWTTDPELVIDGFGSLLGQANPPDAVWSLYACSDPEELPLMPGGTYTITFKYRVVAEPGELGYFFVGAQSQDDIHASDRNALVQDNLPPGTLGQARGELILGHYSDYYLYWGMKHGGEIVIDSIVIKNGRGVHRRDFEEGIALVNPTYLPIVVNVGAGFRRIEGIVDPQTNNGQPVTAVTLGWQDGLVLLRMETQAIEPWYPENRLAPPAAGPIYAFPNPIGVASAPLVRFAGVPAGGSITVISPLGRTVRRISAADPAGVWSWDLSSQRNRPVAAGVYLAVVRNSDRQVIQTLRLALSR
jgi:hypothetical protein